MLTHDFTHIVAEAGDETLRPHWTETHQFQSDAGELATAAELYGRYRRCLHLYRFSSIAPMLGDAVRMDDHTRWTRIR